MSTDPVSGASNSAPPPTAPRVNPPDSHQPLPNFRSHQNSKPAQQGPPAAFPFPKQTLPNFRKIPKNSPPSSLQPNSSSSPATSTTTKKSTPVSNSSKKASSSNSKKSKPSVKTNANATPSSSAPASQSQSRPPPAKSSNSNSNSNSNSTAEPPLREYVLSDYGQQHSTPLPARGVSEKYEKFEVNQLDGVLRQGVLNSQFQNQINSIEDPKNDYYRQELSRVGGLKKIGESSAKAVLESMGKNPEELKESLSVPTSAIPRGKWLEGTFCDERIFTGSGMNPEDIMIDQDPNDPNSKTYLESFLIIDSQSSFLMENVPAASAVTVNTMLSSGQSMIAQGGVRVFTFQESTLKTSEILEVVIAHVAEAKGKKGALIINVSLAGGDALSFIHTKRLIAFFFMIFTLIIYDVSCNWSVSGTGLSKVLKKNGSCSTESAAYQEKSFWRNGEDWDGPGAEACENLEKDYIMKWEAGAIVPLNASGLLFTLEIAKTTRPPVSEAARVLKTVQKQVTEALAHSAALDLASSIAVQKAASTSMNAKLIESTAQRHAAGASRLVEANASPKARALLQAAQEGAAKMLTIVKANAGARAVPVKRKAVAIEGGALDSKSIKEQSLELLMLIPSYQELQTQIAARQAALDLTTQLGAVPVHDERARNEEIIPTRPSLATTGPRHTDSLSSESADFPDEPPRKKTKGPRRARNGNSDDEYEEDHLGEIRCANCKVFSPKNQTRLSRVWENNVVDGVIINMLLCANSCSRYASEENGALQLRSCASCSSTVSGGKQWLCRDGNSCCNGCTLYAGLFCHDGCTRSLFEVKKAGMIMSKVYDKAGNPVKDAYRCNACYQKRARKSKKG